MTPAATSPSTTRRKVAFPDLVRLHYLWRKSLGSASEEHAAERARITVEYEAALDAFEAEHGPIVNAYWCSEIESAVVMTEKPSSAWTRGTQIRRAQGHFHRVSDWATKEHPDIAQALHKCDELAIRATEVLQGRSRRICLQLVMASACHLLSLVDEPGAPSTDVARQKALASEQRDLDGTARYYREAANGDAQLVYFGGMALGIVFIVALCFGLSASPIDVRGVAFTNVIGCLAAGALGAAVSVIARVNTGTFALDSDVARGYTRFLGALRPLIGAAFGLIMYFAITGNFLEVFKVPGPTVPRFYFLCVVAFLAGFSERWAQDTLTGGLSGRGKDQGKTGATGTRGRPPIATGDDAGR
jgi:hypothetical protein